MVTRQERRKFERAAKARVLSAKKVALTDNRRAALRERGSNKIAVPPTASQIEQRRKRNEAAEAAIRTRKIGQRGEFGRRILTEYVSDGIEYSFHATKGMRAVRKPLGGQAVVVGRPAGVVIACDHEVHKAAAAEKRARRADARKRRYLECG